MHQEDSQRPEEDIVILMEWAADRRRELDMAVKSLKERVSQEQLWWQNLRDERVALRQKMAEELQVEREKT